jgi:hypothetical protein
METSHFISNLALGLTGTFVLFRHFLKLPLLETILWKSFILSVSVAAIFGAVRFAGIEKAVYVSSFFQNIAATVGVLGLVVVAWFKVLGGNTLDMTIGASVLSVGFILFIVHQILEIQEVLNHVPFVSMILISLAALKGLINGHIRLGLWLLGGTFFSFLALFRTSFIPNPSHAIDAYRYFLLLSIICFTFAVARPSFRKMNQ